MEIPLKTSARVTLSEDIDIDSDEGYTASPYFTDYVEQYVPATNKLTFRDSAVGWAEFESMVDEADAIEVIYDYETS